MAAYFAQLLASEDGLYGLADFVRRHDPDQLPPPNVEDGSALAALMENGWQVMFEHLTTAVASPRSQALAKARKAWARPHQSLADAFLAPVDDIAPMHSPKEDSPVASIALDMPAAGKTQESAGVGESISRAIQQHLRLQQELDGFVSFWTDAQSEREAFVAQNAPRPAPRVRRSIWRSSTWYVRSEAPPSVAEWREPVPCHVPTKQEFAAHLRAWRAKTEKEAEELRAAEANWTKSVADLGKELEARRETKQRHQPIDNWESACQDKLEEARALTTRVDKNLQVAGEVFERISINSLIIETTQNIRISVRFARFVVHTILRLLTRLSPRGLSSTRRAKP